MNWKERVQTLQRDLPAVALAMGHQDTPWYAKAAACIAVGYALSPIDLVPDFIPVLGYLDDLVLLPLLLAFAVKRIPPAVMAECREKAVGMWAGGRPKKWYYAVPVALLWGLAVFFILRAVLSAWKG